MELMGVSADLDSIPSAFIDLIIFADHNYNDQHFSFESNHVLTENK